MSFVLYCTELYSTTDLARGSPGGSWRRHLPRRQWAATPALKGWGLQQLVDGELEQLQEDAHEHGHANDAHVGGNVALLQRRGREEDGEET